LKLIKSSRPKADLLTSGWLASYLNDAIFEELGDSIELGI
jgi:hypothetical protein